MALPTEFNNGTGTYVAMFIVAMLFVAWKNKSGSLNKDDTQIAYITVTISFFFAWLFWACCWLHQLHPLIAPEYEAAE